MTSFVPIKPGQGIKCVTHPDREATVIQYGDVAVEGCPGPVRQCVGVFCSQECAEMERLDGYGVYRNPDAHLGAEEAEILSRLASERIGTE